MYIIFIWHRLKLVIFISTFTAKQSKASIPSPDFVSNNSPLFGYILPKLCPN
ncbi:hypothetical protein BC829DRAFT_395927 [Chytridium lagenaria]|nr:hypothetical protein BC829DRAFT_395927 [Chytridium lagenaria]